MKQYRNLRRNKVRIYSRMLEPNGKYQASSPLGKSAGDGVIQ